MPFLLLYQPGCGPTTLPLHDGFIIGRDAQADLCLPHHQVSRMHARFESRKTGWFVKDLGSANGTFVARIRVTEAKLDDGVGLCVGPCEFMFIENETTTIVHAKVVADLDTLVDTNANQRIAVLAELARALGNLDDTDAIIGRMLDTILEQLGADRAVLKLTGSWSPLSTGQVIRTRQGKSSDEVVLSGNVLNTLLTERKAIILRDDGRRYGTAPPNSKTTCHGMAVPLELAGQMLGFLYVDGGSTKPFDMTELDFAAIFGRLFSAALESGERLQRARAVADRKKGPFDEIAGECSAIQHLRAQIVKYGAVERTSVLVLGDTGTGKELVARALHAASPRSMHPFVAVNCAAIPETLIEGELFGYEKGAFTGALRGKRGYFALADRGTLFFDEIGELSLHAQAKVLRALQEREFVPLGAERSLRVDVRVIAATHKDLRQEVKEGRFREDLFFRLNVLSLHVPRLNERGEDIEQLARMFLEAAALNLGKPLSGFSEDALAALRSYSWPGNVRELENEILRVAVDAEGPMVTIEDLSAVLRPASGVAMASAPGSVGRRSLAERFAALEPTEKALVEEALARARGNVSEAARLLGITRQVLRNRIDRYRLRTQDE